MNMFFEIIKELFANKKRRRRKEEYDHYLSIKASILKCSNLIMLETVNKFRIDPFISSEKRGYYPPLRIKGKTAWIELKKMYFSKKIKFLSEELKK